MNYGRFFGLTVDSCYYSEYIVDPLISFWPLVNLYFAKLFDNILYTFPIRGVRVTYSNHVVSAHSNILVAVALSCRHFDVLFPR